jgi:membrane protein YqaA with SNARE-associated domain
MREKIELATFWIIVLVLAFFIFKNIEIIQDKIGHLILLFGYPAVLILAGLADALEQPIGPEIPGIIAIFFGLNPFIVISLAFLGSTVGSLTSLYVGKRFLTPRIVSFCSTKEHLNLCKIFHKYGKLILALAAISPLPYVTTCWISGAFQIHLKDFFLFGIFPRLLRLSFVLMLFFVGFIL